MGLWFILKKLIISASFIRMEKGGKDFCFEINEK